jgi:flagella synthesis protein FlgN
MSKVRQFIIALISGLKEDIKNYSRFHELLHKQQSLMQQHNSEALITLNQEHSILLEVIREQAIRRKQLMDNIGVTADNAGMEKILAALDAKSSPQVAMLWDKLKQLTHHCHDQNEVNGRLLALQSELLNKVLNTQPQDEYSPNTAGEY